MSLPLPPTRVPSPSKIILGAFAEVKPKLIITVPLILEKIIRNKVFPMLEKPLMKFLLKVPFSTTAFWQKSKRDSWRRSEAILSRL